MEIRYHRLFLKQFDSLPQKIQKKTIKIVALFQANPLDHRLHNHKLSGALCDKRAIDVDYDLRIIFQEFDQYTIVIMLSIGTHDQVYR